MYDSVTPGNIPVDAQAVAGYIDGRYAWRQSDWDRFKTPIKITIAVNDADDAKSLDVEIGNASPVQAPGWVQRQRARGDAYPWVYMNESTWPVVRAAFRAQGVPDPIWWVAGYPGSVGWNLYPGAHAHQVTGDGIYDRSLLADYIPGVDDPATPTTPEEDMPRFVYFTVGPDPANRAWFRSDGTWITHTQSPREGDDNLRSVVEADLGAKGTVHANGQPVDDWKAFGRPIDDDTRAALAAVFG